ncbi:muconolactone Delta-isomerase [Bradyrhizobium sp. U87765 SZCCT0131]|uniref:muconolactone Delta-isomerase n=1 Tax=unclassified Bradyrhizobium TaxID=2631580 RepID=UPI001BA5D11E|nr:MULTISPECIES: muconolactone Delta-isomerase [unclassified Bradyrhizobium]MBR1221067.1 muconolactone Delta-isomerase [Bradyrhizobium sp. U87765 SZCCT0131]MBR1260113.1 muconolactone Delta-isomerase [Bradyrhizobium sp. U87765 SZCCT0134]MBR1307638.1 muconolactone Delta-isomerase [Bradyrhizobium sp. U87765 SZCCT0110]MBR1321592.1 muconolactone Delta-isomerase [Bradyrhizobium sp. U87765 SZCCT0109]MBR1349905.1 muconolactone Delta-isomerase [Bradyrhizobium sp. U87765 SZCCT0048]
MLFQVEMNVEIPQGIAPEVVAQLKDTERLRAQELQRSGQWRHLWRIAGRYANISIFDVESNEALHDILSTLPLFPFMRVTVTPLCRHPSSVHADDR